MSPVVKKQKFSQNKILHENYRKINLLSSFTLSVSQKGKLQLLQMVFDKKKKKRLFRHIMTYWKTKLYFYSTGKISWGVLLYAAKYDYEPFSFRPYTLRAQVQ